MAKYQYKDSEELSFELLPAGDYAFKIIDAEEGMQTKGKTAGSEFISIKIAFGRQGKIVAQWSEKIIFHESIDWKTDQWLRCINFNGGKLSKGEMVDITPQTVIGCRGHVSVIQETYVKQGTGEEKIINKVDKWLTTKGVLERDVDLVALKFPASEPDPFGPGDADF